MGAIADIFAAVHLDLESGTFEVDAAKAAESAGEAMSQKMSGILKAGLRTAVGAALGAAVGTALAGANELDAATAKLRADTGMTADEADRAQSAIAGLYSNNLQGMAEIGDALGTVITDLGLTGDAAVEATDQILAFSTATGIDATQAVAAFDDVLDGFGMTVEDMPGLMDKLIASHQEYGGSIEQNLSALGQMAPQLTALGVDIDDALALLNLFADSGVNAADSTRGLSQAVSKLQPGQSLDDLIAAIAAIEDPTLRAQAAAEIFGSTMGTKMAAALKPGMTGLEDYGFATDEVTGKTEEAAGAIEGSFGNQLQLLLKKAGGFLAEFGTNFGPLVSMAAAVGPQMVTALMSGLGGLAGLLGPALSGALWKAAPGVMITASAVGGAMGSAFSTAMGAAAAVALPAAIAAAAAAAVVGAWAIINDGLNKQAEDISTKTAEFVKTATLDQLEAAEAAIVKGMQDIKNTPFGDILWGDQIRSLGEDLEVVRAAAERARNPIADLPGPFAHAGEAGADAAAGIDAAAGAMTDAKKPVDDLRTSLEKADDAWKTLNDRFRTQNEYANLPDKITVANDAVKTAQKDLNKAIETGNKVAIAAARIRLRDAEAELRELQRRWAQLRVEMSKPVPVGKVYRGPSAGPERLATGGPVEAGMPYIVGDAGRPELFVPKVDGKILPRVPEELASGGAGGGNITVNVTGLVKARDPLEIATQLRRLANLGVLTPRTTT